MADIVQFSDTYNNIFEASIKFFRRLGCEKELGEKKRKRVGEIAIFLST